MRIKKLEILGFKSFSERVSLSFPVGITSIVGPNGCGKSNIVDAVLWVVGERSARHLRARLMEDVIFNGADGDKPMGMAEVSILFSNEDGGVPAEFAGYEEIMVTRRFFRSGESEYYINKNPCRLKDVTDLFAGTGIGTNAYSIIEQGKVEFILNSKPQERRLLFEEAAGVSKFRERKRAALIKMESTEQNLLRLRDIIGEIKRQINGLNRQVKRAERFKTYRGEVKEIESRIAADEYAGLLNKREGIEEALAGLREEGTKVTRRLQRTQNFVEHTRQRLREVEEGLNEDQRRTLGVQNELQRGEDGIEAINRELDRLSHLEKQYLEEIGQLNSKLEETRSERSRMEGVRSDLREQILSEETGLKEREQELESLKRQNEGTMNDLEDQKASLVDILSQISASRNTVSSVGKEIEGLERRIVRNGTEQQEAKGAVEEMEKLLSQSNERMNALISSQEKLEGEREVLRAGIDALRRRIIAEESELKKMEAMLHREGSRLESLRELEKNYEGYDSGVKAVMLSKEKGELDGIYGLIGNMIETDERFEAPLEAALDRKLQHIVVKGLAEGMQAIRYLKDRSCGRSTFIPITPKGSIRAVEGESRSKEEGLLGSLAQFVKVKEGFSPVIAFLLEDVWLVDNLEIAHRLWKKGNGFRTLVTLDGEVLERDGSLTGGGIEEGGFGLLERRRLIKKLENSVSGLEEQIRLKETANGKLTDTISAKERELDDLLENRHKQEIELMDCKRDVEQRGQGLIREGQRLEILEFDGRQLQAELETRRGELEGLSNQLRELDNRKREGEEKISEWQAKLDEENMALERINRDVTGLKVNTAAQREKMNAIEAVLGNLEQSQRGAKDEIARKLREVERVRGEISDARQRVEALRKQGQQSVKELKSLTRTVNVQKRQKERLAEVLREGESGHERLTVKRDEIGQKTNELNLKMAEVHLSVEHLEGRVSERHGLSLEKLLEERVPDFQREPAERRLDELQSALDELGGVNLVALDEYEELKGRYDFLMEQKRDLEEAMDDLRKAISRINRTTTRQFLKTFEAVKGKFQEVFARLFEGGMGDLVLTDERDLSITGIEIVAQPPGKRLQNIDLLSGGEKALVAIALLFSFFLVKPTPLCLMDEVDGPLDDANIDRFAAFVSELSKTSQFILVTHNKKTIEMSNTLYGVTMETPGISKVVSVKLN
ncbi:MAG: chromosome segregation protein SMC [Syntrophobacterales bacterium]|nr:MAG: chromosome segregation protein SMC [Syntrophobacterales bacterium]